MNPAGLLAGIRIVIEAIYSREGITDHLIDTFRDFEDKYNRAVEMASR